MELNEFVKNFEDQFDDIETGTIKPETEFRSVEGWGSLRAMLVIAMVDADYGVTLSGNDIKNSKTVLELYELVKSKQ